ncbi:prepilin-type N-terminal cleavage/methylation domain-containing protein [Arenimonas sp.]|uniref:prepilin-type N-terminal cleavage/methylation domain-containing protein n=1 Tax=Arenimonas sp. TaxID=1872635 RepID=UPI0035ADC69F
MNRRRGFTLVEMLVVLMLVGLLVALVFDALAVFRMANERVADRSFTVRQATLVHHWFNESVAGLRVVVPAPEPGRADAPAFEGTATGFRGTSLLPLRGGAGVAAEVAWQLDAGAGELTYRQSGSPDVTFPAPEGMSGFVYFDGVDEWHEQWPPRLGVAATLPAEIAWVRETAGGRRLSPVAVIGPRDAIYHPFEPERD